MTSLCLPEGIILTERHFADMRVLRVLCVSMYMCVCVCFFFDGTSLPHVRHLRSIVVAAISNTHPFMKQSRRTVLDALAHEGASFLYPTQEEHCFGGAHFLFGFRRPIRRRHDWSRGPDRAWCSRLPCRVECRGGQGGFGHKRDLHSLSGAARESFTPSP